MRKLFQVNNVEQFYSLLRQPNNQLISRYTNWHANNAVTDGPRVKLKIYADLFVKPTAVKSSTSQQ